MLISLPLALSLQLDRPLKSVTHGPRDLCHCQIYSYLPSQPDDNTALDQYETILLLHHHAILVYLNKANVFGILFYLSYWKHVHMDQCSSNANAVNVMWCPSAQEDAATASVCQMGQWGNNVEVECCMRECSMTCTRERCKVGIALGSSGLGL